MENSFTIVEFSVKTLVLFCLVEPNVLSNKWVNKPLIIIVKIFNLYTRKHSVLVERFPAN